MHKITPFLWFDDQAEEAAHFYTSIFKNSKINTLNRFNDAVPGPKGKTMSVTFELDGQEFMALNGGPGHPFTDAISLFVNCASQAEIDDLWSRLSAGGEEGPCGWLKDKYGLSWQIVPAQLVELMSDPDSEKARRVTQAMLQMKKIDIAALERAYQQG
ncbi:MAG TPA: VOC family protein [Anaerolineaceae bacterium]|jgi:predicted 3-demethylubiquinone-9 3-methyltransferase (glyoxalase superfamily)|nr:VOC family protein [Anaerolineaceae bacterium]